MAEEISAEEGGLIWQEAKRLAKEEGFESAYRYLRTTDYYGGFTEHGLRQLLGFHLGTWQPVDYDEDGNEVVIRD
jgi:hypothetical protein